MTFDPTTMLGWLGRTEEGIRLSADIPHLHEAAPGLYTAGGDDGSPILLWKSVTEVLGSWPGYVPQEIGDCVSHGAGHANDVLQCVEIALDGKGEWRETDTEFLYGTSREVAGMLGRGDGSYGGAVVKAMATIGMVSREMLGGDGAYSGDRAKAWGARGVPAAARALAAPYRLGTYAGVRTWDDLVAAFRAGHPVIECCGWFGQGQRDAQGFVRDWGRGGHCQAIVGVRFDRPGACLLNSWPDSMYSGPRPDDMPNQCYWLPRDWVERMLGEGDSYAIAASPYFKPRALPSRWRWSDAA